ncbi:hypothetical protein [Kaarinaea lacus]
MRKIAFVFASCLALSACSSTGSDTSASASGGASDVEKLIKDAEASIKKAASVGGEWRDTNSQLLKKAKAALSKGDVETAAKMAEAAKFEGEMGYQQAVDQKNAGPWLF